MKNLFTGLKRIIPITSVILNAVCIQAQTVNLTGNVEDGFLKTPLPEAIVTILRSDSTVVADSVPVTLILNGQGEPVNALFYASIQAAPGEYLVRAQLEGYDEAWQRVTLNVPLPKNVNVPTLEMRKSRQIDLDEVEVTATKVKMYYKGDTIVYNADAFKLPDGSMLDALIRQLPGVTMNDEGEIFVNGRKVDELLLGSRSFFRGNKKVLMDNLPYYTVKDVKVYDKQTDLSEALGHDVEPRRFVMDVNLRPEYNRGYIANVEAAGGTEDRYLARAFLLGFTDRWRYSLMGNLNNVNETRHVGQQGHWTPSGMPNQVTTTRSVAVDLDYQSADKNLDNKLNAGFTSMSNRMDMRQRYEQFLEGRTPTSFTESMNRSGHRSWNLHNSLTLKKPCFFRVDADFNHIRRDGSFRSVFEQWDDSLTAAMRTVGMSEGRKTNGQLDVSTGFNVGKETQDCEGGSCNTFQRYMGLSLSLYHGDERSEQAARYATRQSALPAEGLRHNANDYRNRETWGVFSLNYSAKPHKGINLRINETLYFISERKHDYLYHPDTLTLASQLDALQAITDPGNSYRSRFDVVENGLKISLVTRSTYKLAPNVPFTMVYSPWDIGVDLQVRHDELDYQRGSLDTLVSRNSVFANPYLSYRYMSKDGKRDFRFNANHTRSSIYLYDLVNYRDDSAPLVVKLGNPDLKSNAASTLAADYTDRTGQHMQQYHFGASLNYWHRLVAQSVAYEPATGVYTYRPMNVGGAYTVNGKADYFRGLDRNNRWTLQANADASLHHSVDHAMFAGETESHENIVNTLTLHDNTYIQYCQGSLNARATGDITWRHSEGRMYDFTTLEAFDFHYGLSARYTLPRLNTTLSADATMYSRRGYGSAELNTDDFVLNASLSQPFLKGKLIARIEAFDLLHQVSSTQYAVSAQGRTETWYRSLPHYVMLHLVYHWNKNPKKR